MFVQRTFLQLTQRLLEHLWQSPFTSQVLTCVQSRAIGVTRDARYPSSRRFLRISRVMLDTLIESSRAISLIVAFAFKSLWIVHLSSKVR
ncbi:MAG: hypothetical protein Q8S43_04080 [Actinomycetota bacterium]|nr:hypothetical protein [Actinomycetota bacterium]